jgi:hypothetical protein
VSVLQVGAQPSGAGAGRITFNTFSITRKIDTVPPSFFAAPASGASFSFNKIDLSGKASVVSLINPSADSQTNAPTNPWTHSVVVKGISWAHDDESPKETVTFQYGGMVVVPPQPPPRGVGSSLNPVTFGPVSGNVPVNSGGVSLGGGAINVGAGPGK